MNSKRLTLHTDYSPVTDFMVLTADKVAGCNTIQGTVKVLPSIRLITLGSDSMVLIRWLGEYTFQRTVKWLTLHTAYSPGTNSMVLIR